MDRENGIHMHASQNPIRGRIDAAHIVRRWVSPDCRDPRSRGLIALSSFYAEINAPMCVQQMTSIIGGKSVLIIWINNFTDVDIVIQ